MKIIRRCSITCLLLLVCLTAFPGQRSTANNPSKRYNIISIVTDDQASWTVGAYGNRESITPNMDRLVREGAKFTNAFVTTPVCSPSRAGFLTGLYSTQAGITDWISPKEAENGLGLPPRTTTWPEVLQRSGYRTALFGKWHLGTKPQFHPTKTGFDYFFGSLAGSFEPMNPTLEVDGKPQKLQGPASDLVMSEALKFIEKNKDTSFAALIHFREPHTPYTPMPEEDTALFRNSDPTIPRLNGLDIAQVKQWHREYYAAVHAIDRNLGRLLAKLDELGLAENTIVMFTSDHGYNIGQHMIHTKGNGYWIAGGVAGPTRPNMFDTSLRIPLLIRWPGMIKPGTEIKETIIHLDTFASVLGMLGIKSPAALKQNGMDFSPLLRSEILNLKWRDTFFGQYDLHNNGLAFMRMIRTDDWKLVRHHAADQLDELYDLKNDPGETRNFYNNQQYQEVRNGLQKRLTAWQRSINDPLLRESRINFR